MGWNLDTIYRDKASARVPGPCGYATFCIVNIFKFFKRSIQTLEIYKRKCRKYNNLPPPPPPILRSKEGYVSFLLTTLLPRCCSVALVLLLLCGLTVTDAAAQVTLSLSPTSLTEDAGSADIAVKATLSTSRSSATTITLSLGGTATEGESKDYTVNPDPLPTITIPANTTTGNTTLVVSPVDDTIYEGDETIEVNGSAGSLTVTGASLNLTDNDEAPSISIVVISPSYNPRLYAEQATSQEMVFEARLEGGTTLEEDLDITLVLEGDAIKGEDYTVDPDPLPLITIPAGQTTGRLTFTVTAVNNMEISADESIMWRVSVEDETLSVTVVPQPSRISIEKTGRDFGVRTSIEGRSNWVYEDSGPVTVTFEAFARGNDPLGAPATVTIWEFSEVFTLSPNPVIITIAADQVPPVATGTATLTLVPEFDDDRDRTLVLPTSFDFPALRRRLSSGEVRVLTRDDVRLVDINRSGSLQARYIENERISFIVSFWSYFRSTKPGILQIYLDNDLRKATCGASSTPFLYCHYVVSAGDYANTIRIPAQESLYPEDTVFTHYYSEESITVQSEVTAAQAQEDMVQVRGGLKYIELLTDLESLQEGVGATEVEVRATLLQGSLPTTDIEIPLVLTDDTTTPADYEVSGTQAITIPANQSSGSTHLLITPVDDYVKENRTETVQITGGMSLYYIEGTELDIIDAPSIMLSVSPSAITENGGSQQVVVTAGLGDPSDQVRPRPIPVTLRLFGSAGGGDYTVAGQLLVTIPANARSSTATLTFTPVNDRLLEGDETIVLRGSTPGLTVERTELVLQDDDMVPEVSADHKR